MKVPIIPAEANVIRRHYPLAELVAGWFFRCEEVSVGCYLAEGCNLYGQQVSHQSTYPAIALQECVASARQLLQTSSSAA